MVLATEMTKHFEHVNKFVNSINKPLAALEEDGVSEHLIAKGACVWGPYSYVLWGSMGLGYHEC